METLVVKRYTEKKKKTARDIFRLYPAFKYHFTCANKQVLHKIGAERACAAVVALDAPGANYRCVWALSKYYPNVKTFVRAHDVVHGLNLEKAGATAVMFTNLSTFHEIRHAFLVVH